MCEKSENDRLGDLIAAISKSMEEDEVSQLESVPANQVKGKRRNKLKMPLKKIPKRKQSSLNEQINICQDIANFDYPENISALIVSSLHGPGENMPSVHLPPLQSSVEKITSNNAANSAEGNLLKSRSCESVDWQRKSAHPPPPLVSIARLPGTKQPTPSVTSRNMSPTSGVAGGTEACNKMLRQPMTVSSSTLLRGDSQAAMSSSTLFSSLPQAENLLKNNGSHNIIQGGCQPDKGMSRASPRLLEPQYDFVHSEDPRQCQMHAKLSEPGGTIKVMRPVINSDNYNSHCRYDVSDMIKSKLCMKSHAKSYKTFSSDVRLPLVQVKPPFLTPISPEKKRSPANKKSLLTMKKNVLEGTSATTSTRGRKPNEKNQQNKENSEGVDKKLPGYKKNRQKRYPYTDFARDEETDEDDVIITGVVSLNDLRHYEQNSTSPKRMVKFGRRKNSKYYANDRGNYDVVDNFNPNDKYECYYENTYHLNSHNISNQSNKKKPVGKRGGYTRKNAKNLVNANDINAKDKTDKRMHNAAHVHCDLTKKETHRCERKCSNSLLKSDGLVSQTAGDAPREQLKLCAASFPSSSHNQRELDDRKRDEHFSTIIDAIKKEDDLIKSSMSKKVNVSMTETDAVDWRSWLTVFDRNSSGNSIKTEVLEIGSGTDSGNEDDLVLRDLSEFLLLSEDRRHSRKQTEVFDSAPFKSLSCPKRNFRENDFNFDGSKINFDSIDSSINLINSIDTDVSSLKIDYESKSMYVEDDGINYEENIYYSKWQSLYDNYPKYPVQNRYKNRSDTYWKRFMLTERNPLLADTNQYQYRSIIPDKEKRLEESATKAGCILRSETAERGIAPSYESKFYKKRIYRKKNKLSQDVESW